MGEVVEIQKEEKHTLWSRNFLLLWQGQFVSGLGDMVYEIALGFWVLAVSGSTLMMTLLMAATMVPTIIISPFAGVIVDKSNRRRLLVIMDLIRGGSVLFVAVAAILGLAQLWMVFVAGIIIGTCGAFFSPAVSSALPDIVPPALLMKANGAFSMIFTGSNISGNAAGGVLYRILGAPLMFLFNGISFLISAFTILFLKIPKLEKEGEKIYFKKDMKEGMDFVWNFRGLRYLIIMALVLNFFGTMAMTLFIPFFKLTPGLGADKYGFASAMMGVGAFLGMTFTMTYNIIPERRFKIYILSSAIAALAFALFAVFRNYAVMLMLICIGAFFNSIINIFFQSSIQLTVPAHMRGKVFSLMGTVMTGTMPIAMICAGFISKLMSIRSIIFVCFMIILILFLPFAFLPSFKNFINFNPERETLEDIM